MKKLIISVIAGVALVACANTNLQYNEQQFSNESYQKNVINAIEYADNFVDFDQNNVPKASLDTQDFSVLLDADIAFNQGDYAKAAGSYYTLANKYQDPRLVYKGIICYEHINANQEQYSKLNQLIYQLIKLAPDAKVTKLFAIRVALENNQLALAKSNLKTLMAADPSKRRAILLFLATIISNDLNHNAQVDLDQFATYVSDKYGNYPEGYLLGVVAYSLAGDKDKLLATLTIIDQRYPTWEVPVYWSAGMLSKQNNLSLLLDMVEMEIHYHQQPSVTLQNLFLAALVRSGRLTDAQAYIDECLQKNPDNNNMLINKAVIDYKLINPEQAARDLALVVQHQYLLDGAVNLALGALYGSMDANESAIANYKLALGRNQVLAPAANLGILRSYLKQGDITQANIFLDQIAQLNHLKPREATIFKISLLTELGFYAPAYLIAAQAIKVYAADKSFIYYYASLSGLTGHTKQAISWYRKYIKLNPSDSVGYNDLGFLLADKTSDYHQALILANHAYQLAPKDAAVLDTLGWVYYKMKHYSQAQQYLELAYQQTHDRDTAVHLQQVYLAQNLTDLAAQVVILDPQVLQKQFEQTMLGQAILILMYYQYGLDLSR